MVISCEDMQAQSPFTYTGNTDLAACESDISFSIPQIQSNDGSVFVTDAEAYMTFE